MSRTSPAIAPKNGIVSSVASSKAKTRQAWPGVELYDLVAFRDGYARLQERPCQQECQGRLGPRRWVFTADAAQARYQDFLCPSAVHGGQVYDTSYERSPSSTHLLPARVRGRCVRGPTSPVEGLRG